MDFETTTTEQDMFIKLELGMNSSLMEKDIEKLVSISIKDPEKWYWLAFGLAKNANTPQPLLVKMSKIKWGKPKTRKGRSTGRLLARVRIGSGPAMVAIANQNMPEEYLANIVDSPVKNFFAKAPGVASSPNATDEILKKLVKKIREKAKETDKSGTLKMYKYATSLAYKNPNWVKRTRKKKLSDVIA